MTRGSRALCALYTATALWLGYCTLQQAHYGQLWPAALLAVASLAPIIGVIRETVLADERHQLAALAERDARPGHGRPLTAHEQAAFNRLALAIELPNDPRNTA
ncbi:hypothetical protein [Streptomyces sp. 6-11-2]|uniref:hypothetical protein n=1 Tax=Streptomyces sp. 6-11-2 TaxID=2585753 RepID=UPI001142C626|nr:hypothetical protein [Streptomyces sp. 6-11-2]GED89354.1 hypothetical protein TNCT6_64390 [Streptomyces sp. 6-11-2]